MKREREIKRETHLGRETERKERRRAIALPLLISHPVFTGDADFGVEWREAS